MDFFLSLISCPMPSASIARGCDAVGVGIIIYVDVWMTAAMGSSMRANGTPSMLFYLSTLVGQTHIRLRINDDHCAIQLLIELISYSNEYALHIMRGGKSALHMTNSRSRFSPARYWPH